MNEIEDLFSEKKEELLEIFIDRMNSSFKEEVSSRFIKFSTVDLEVGQYHESFSEFIDQVKVLNRNHDERFTKFLEDLHNILKNEFNTDDIDQELPSFNYTL
jgi:hypothetical protein